ncbi:thiazolylpeptide-type bacteriocin [Rathayibacter tritici]|uniref:thiazolylpeptide-type bacteriocin n=1 Tax=Rathayibacter tritici TaxID=33888 RepID=UPI000A7FC8E6|nr:thiazolylpeptide-type bacteriocin [Rathayibacter tritici]
MNDAGILAIELDLDNIEVIDVAKGLDDRALGISASDTWLCTSSSSSTCSSTC